jgi:hypothetical protein
MNDQHILTFIKTVHWTDLNAVHEFAADAIFGNDVGHLISPACDIGQKHNTGSPSLGIIFYNNEKQPQNRYLI